MRNPRRFPAKIAVVLLVASASMPLARAFDDVDRAETRAQALTAEAVRADDRLLVDKNTLDADRKQTEERPMDRLETGQNRLEEVEAARGRAFAEAVTGKSAKKRALEADQNKIEADEAARDRAVAEAVQAWSDAIRLSPHEGSIYLNRGAAYELAGDSGRAMADYTEAIRLDPDLAGVR